MVDEQFELDWQSELPSNADEAAWIAQHVPTPQSMTRDPDVSRHEDLLHRHEMRTARTKLQ